MQKFGFLNHGFVKDVSSCGIHLQSVFSTRIDHLKTQIAGKSRTDFADIGPGIFFVRCFECNCEHMDGITPILK
jgi:hypothetical protein